MNTVKNLKVTHRINVRKNTSDRVDREVSKWFEHAEYISEEQAQLDAVKTACNARLFELSYVKVKFTH